jgi:hypothetical protein
MTIQALEKEHWSVAKAALVLAQSVEQYLRTGVEYDRIKLQEALTLFNRKAGRIC